MSRPPIHTFEALTKILDSQCSNASFSIAAARAGVSVTSLNRWRNMSANGDPAFILEWMGQEAQFSSHLALARLQFMASMEAAALNRAHFGTTEKVFYQGRPSWVLDPRYEGWSDERLADNLLDNEDRFIHDEVTHARVQHVIEHAPPVELQKAALSAYAKRWQPATHVDVNQTVALGVTMVGARPKAIDVTPKPAQIEHVGKPTEVSGVFTEVAPVEESPHTDTHTDDSQRTGEPLTTSPPDKIDRSPENPVRVALLAEMENRNRRIEGERAAGKLPTVAPVSVAPATDPEGIDDMTGERIAAPAPPTMDSVALAIHAIKKKLHDNVPMGPIERQVANALRRGSEADARTLLGFRPSEQDGLGAGKVPPGGAAVVTSASTRGNPVKMI
jgi:hypothetical protein